MPTLKTTYYADGLFFEGVDVHGVFNYSRFEPDVAAANYATAQRLAAAGCRIRLGPPNQTFHAKILIVDRSIAFVGSHNITRGALTFNRELTSCTQVKELVNRVGHYFNQLWYASIPFAQAPPPTNLIPLVIELLGVAAEGAELALTFEPNLTDGVDAFAAVAAPLGTLAGAVMGATVAPTDRVARVTPTVESGAPVFVAVRGYNAGQTIATSNVIQLTYQPSGTGGGDGEGGGGGGSEP
ncbi:MAG: hypothetical protein HYU43_08710, partial [Armatimonadetes bacterium]|nr:hypothetical protein [Armatimonadota bacterium]